MLLHFKLIWAAVLMVQYRRSSGEKSLKPVVSLQCEERGSPTAIHCNITAPAGCTVDQYLWRDSEGNNICSSGDWNYSCDCDNRTFVSLVITKATCGIYRVDIDTAHGVAHSEFSVKHCVEGE